MDCNEISIWYNGLCLQRLRLEQNAAPGQFLAQTTDWNFPSS